MDKNHKRILDQSWSHPYSCDCDTCLSGWALLGPDGGVPGDYGPFTRKRVNERQRLMGLQETH